MEHQKALEDIVYHLSQPGNPENRDQIKEAKKRLEKMYRLYDGFAISHRRSSHGD
jgi:hypothetical protein